jgi:hypothetical protein
MTRRTMALLVTLTFGLLVVPLAAEAQRPGTTPRIAYFSLAPGPGTVYSEAFVHGLRELGYKPRHDRLCWVSRSGQCPMPGA